jgi:hypothetical protein
MESTALDTNYTDQHPVGMVTIPGPDIDPEAFDRWLNTHLAARGLTRRGFAAAIGSHPSTITEMSARTWIRPAFWRRVCEGLGITPTEARAELEQVMARLIEEKTK